LTGRVVYDIISNFVPLVMMGEQEGTVLLFIEE